MTPTHPTDALPPRPVTDTEVAFCDALYGNLDVESGLAPLYRRRATVTALGTNTVTISIGGTSVAGVRFLDGYSPAVNDVVYVDLLGGDPVVIGMVNTGGNPPVPLSMFTLGSGLFGSVPAAAGSFVTAGRVLIQAFSTVVVYTSGVNGKQVAWPSPFPSGLFYISAVPGDNASNLTSCSPVMSGCSTTNVQFIAWNGSGEVANGSVIRVNLMGIGY